MIQDMPGPEIYKLQLEIEESICLRPLKDSLILEIST